METAVLIIILALFSLVIIGLAISNARQKARYRKTKKLIDDFLEKMSN